MHHSLSIHSFTDGHLGCFSTTVNKNVERSPTLRVLLAQGHADLLCIVPALVYVPPKRARVSHLLKTIILTLLTIFTSVFLTWRINTDSFQFQALPIDLPPWKMRVNFLILPPSPSLLPTHPIRLHRNTGHVGSAYTFGKHYLQLHVKYYDIFPFFPFL